MVPNQCKHVTRTTPPFQQCIHITRVHLEGSATFWKKPPGDQEDAHVDKKDKQVAPIDGRQL
ncbi:hypothetical protein Hanom_Chr07g00597971 [Helianthus anomalus]